MISRIEFDPMMAMATVSELPLKSCESPTPHEDILTIMDEARANLKPYDSTATRGTCVDERPRVGLRSGESIVEVRPSAPGGPDIYGLAVAELTGAFGDSKTDAVTRLAGIKKTLNTAGLLSGGHEGCAANDSFGVWVPIVAAQAEAISSYVESKFSEDGIEYDQSKMNTVIENAKNLEHSGKYGGWTESNYFYVLGDEANEAIERLAPVSHQGVMKIWVDIEGQTVDQTALDNKAFVLDKPYMKQIENVIANGPEATRIAELAPYARYAIVQAISFALPNSEIQEGTIS